MRGIWRDVADLVLPVGCAGCGGVRAVLCEACGEQLWGRVPGRVSPSPEPAGLPVVHAAAPYADVVRSALLAHKERGAMVLSDALGRALAGAVRAGVASGGEAQVREGGEVGTRAGAETGVDPGQAPRSGRVCRGQPLLLVPVPSARRAVGRRGHDPTRRIALATARRLRGGGTAVEVVSALRHCRVVADQSGLNSRERQANVRGAFELAPGVRRLLAGRRIVIVDDLMTTGATLAEAARALRRAGTRDLTTMVRTVAAVVASSPDSFEINRN